MEIMEMNCPHCGSTLRKGVFKFCPECGFNLSQKEIINRSEPIKVKKDSPPQQEVKEKLLYYKLALSRIRTQPASKQNNETTPKPFTKISAPLKGDENMGLVMDDKIDVEKLEKKLKFTGITVSVIGWATIFFSIAMLLTAFEKDFLDPDIFMMDILGSIHIIVVSSIFIILGNRIKMVEDKNIKLYLHILSCLSLTIIVSLLGTGGRVGGLLFLTLPFLISALVSIRKAMKVEEFTSTLSSPKYMFGKKCWICFTGIATILFIAVAGSDVDFLNNNHDTKNQTQVNITANDANASTWKEFNSTIGHFKIELPTSPQYETKNVPVPNKQYTMKTDLYTSEETNGTIYLIGMITYPSELDFPNTDHALEGGLNGILTSNKNNKLISSNMDYFNQHRALNFLIQNKTIFMKGKLIWADGKSYELFVAYNGNSFNELDYNKFINSFVLF